MHVKSSIDDSPLLEIRVEGTLVLDPGEARGFLRSLVNSPLADNVVIRVGNAGEWTKVSGSWATAVRDGRRPFVDERTLIQPVQKENRSHES